MKKCKCGNEFAQYNRLNKLCVPCRIKKKKDDNSNKPFGKIKTKGHGMAGGQLQRGDKGEVGRQVGKNRIPKVTVRQKETNGNLSAAKNKLLEISKACTSCLRESEIPQLSHVIPRSIRKDLEKDGRNLILQCHSCHENWEHKKWDQIIKFKNFWEIFLRVRSMDEGHYWRLVHRYKEWARTRPRKAVPS